ncbi:MAG: hypothetical protein LRZ88_12760 [Candidatus Cloacimonetes bacterium]|nr:hypothetical protein [Candidatus Cloacimonadota bacterium]
MKLFWLPLFLCIILFSCAKEAPADKVTRQKLPEYYTSSRHSVFAVPVWKRC